MAVRLALTVIAVAAIGAVAGPAYAGGGGCAQSNRNDFNISACSADDGVYMYPDAYIMATPTTGDACVIKSTIVFYNALGTTTAVRPAEYTDCRRGHATMTKYYLHGLPYYPRLHHRIDGYMNGTRVFTVIGPATTH